MNNSESSLIHSIGHPDYGSTQPTSTCQVDATTAHERASFTTRNAGILFIIAAQFFFASMTISVKMLNNLESPVHAFQIIIVRMGITFICSEIYMIIMRIPDPILGPKDVRTLLVIRAVTGFFGLSGLYLSVQYLSVADATALGFLKPLTTAVAGCILLKEKYSVKQAVAGVCSLLGVVLIARPPFLFPSLLAAIPEGHYLPGSTPVQRLAGVGAVMVSVLGATGAYTSIRAIGKRAHPLHIMTSFSLGCTFIASLGMVVFNISFVYPTSNSWTWSLLLLMNGIFGFGAQALLTMGLQRETVSRGVTGVYIEMLFVVVLERLIFGVIPSLLSVIGAAIIMSSALYVVVSGHRSRFLLHDFFAHSNFATS
ncbi:hypothetical protein DFH29DRAFT_845909 [Suillus ampliporus]|nr:hypothetical protein DFH29DRAFT_845909 [Suillus ampliporus]